MFPSLFTLSPFPPSSPAWSPHLPPSCMPIVIRKEFPSTVPLNLTTLLRPALNSPFNRHAAEFLAPLPELGLGLQAAWDPPPPPPCSMLHPAPLARRVACQVEQLFPKQTLHKLSCPGPFLTFNARLLPLPHLHVPSPGGAPCQILLSHLSGPPDSSRSLLLGQGPEWDPVGVRWASTLPGL